MERIDSIMCKNLSTDALIRIINASVETGNKQCVINIVNMIKNNLGNKWFSTMCILYKEQLHPKFNEIINMEVCTIE